MREKVVAVVVQDLVQVVIDLHILLQVLKEEVKMNILVIEDQDMDIQVQAVHIIIMNIQAVQIMN